MSLFPFRAPSLLLLFTLAGCGSQATTSASDGGRVADARVDDSAHDASAHDAARDAPPTCEAIGSSCASETACCSNYCSRGLCACNAVGYACQTDVDCCSGSTCGTGGLCVSGDAMCGGVGSACATGSSCCTGYCSASVCACNAPGYACKGDSDCCDGSACGPSGTCTPSFAVCQKCDLVDGGAPCGPNEYCIPVGDFPPVAYCAASCGENTSGTCSAGFTCTDLAALEEGPPGSEACLSNASTCDSPDGGAPYCATSCASTDPPPPCPCANYTCQATSLGYFCLSTIAPTANLCDPCGPTTPCAGGYECVSYGDAGGAPFCAPSCGALTCPSGTTCTQDTAPSTLVCVPVSGSCADGGA